MGTDSVIKDIQIWLDCMTHEKYGENQGNFTWMYMAICELYKLCNSSGYTLEEFGTNKESLVDLLYRSASTTVKRLLSEINGIYRYDIIERCILRILYIIKTMQKFDHQAFLESREIPDKRYERNPYWSEIAGKCISAVERSVAFMRYRMKSIYLTSFEKFKGKSYLKSAKSLIQLLATQPKNAPLPTINKPEDTGQLHL